VTSELPARLRGIATGPGTTGSEAEVVLAADSLSLRTAGGAGWSAAYRDVTGLSVEGGRVQIVLGLDEGAQRWQLERLGAMAGLLVRLVRDGRLRQLLGDGLVEIGADDAVPLVEFAAGSATGIAQLAYHARGAVVAPLDERQPWLRVRRADIGEVAADPSTGGVSVGSAGPSLPPGAGGEPALRLLRLGPQATLHAQRWSGLRDGAASDAAAIVAGLIPDAPFGARSLASRVLLEGRAAGPADLGEAWPALEAAVLGVPPFDEAYRALRAVGGGDAAPRWLACAPERPGTTDSPRLWFLVGLPGNLVALELVSGGAHATYLFRTVPRQAYDGTLPPGALDAAVRMVSEALTDARFLREPMALPGPALARPEGLRYRLALAALPSLAAARRAFVARVAHRDPGAWEAAIRDLVAWHCGIRDDAAEWPGRAAQEAEIREAADPPGGTGSD